MGHAPSALLILASILLVPLVSAGLSTGTGDVSLSIENTTDSLQYGNVLHFRPVLRNTGNATVDLTFPCFDPISYEVSLLRDGRWEPVYERPVCSTVIEKVSLAPGAALAWDATWDQVVWSRAPEREGPETHAPLGHYRFEVKAVPIDSHEQFHAEFEFDLVESWWARPEAAATATAFAALFVILLVVQFRWRTTVAARTGEPTPFHWAWRKGRAAASRLSGLARRRGRAPPETPPGPT